MSTVADIESLTSQLKSKMTDYQGLYTTYINDLSTNILPGYAFAGAGGQISTSSDVADALACRSLCSADTTCTGATFTAVGGACSLQKGTGTVTPSTGKTSINLKYRVDLIDLQTNLDESVEIYSLIQSSIAAITSNSASLITNDMLKDNNDTLAELYQQLIANQQQLKLLNSNTPLNNSFNDSYQYIISSIFWYRFWIFICIFVMLLICQLLFGLSNKFVEGSTIFLICIYLMLSKYMFFTGLSIFVVYIAYLLSK